MTDTPLRDRILDTAHRLVLERGFSATSLNDVLTEAGASKGAFFHHFAGKSGLGHALVERYAEADSALLDEFMGRAEQATDDPAEQLVAFVRGLEEAADGADTSQPGCLFVSFVYEQVPETAATRELIADAVRLWRERILAKLEHPSVVDRLPAGLDRASLADQVFTTFEGAFILARATDDSSHVRAQLAHLRRYFALLLDVPAA